MTAEDGPTALRCRNCNRWLGESTEPLIFIEHVRKSADVHIRPPRDLRFCKNCNCVNVFVNLKDLDTIRNPALVS